LAEVSGEVVLGPQVAEDNIFDVGLVEEFVGKAQGYLGRHSCGLAPVDARVDLFDNIVRGSAINGIRVSVDSELVTRVVMEGNQILDTMLEFPAVNRAAPQVGIGSGAYLLGQQTRLAHNVIRDAGYNCTLLGGADHQRTLGSRSIRGPNNASFRIHKRSRNEDCFDSTVCSYCGSRGLFTAFRAGAEPH